MKAISLHQPWASLLVTRQPHDFNRCHCDQWGRCLVDCPTSNMPMVKLFETRSWPCPPALIGQPIAIHATKREPTHLQRVGDWTTHTSYYTDGPPEMRRLGSVVNGELAPDRYERGLVVDLPLGAIVGSGRITASYPIVGEHHHPLPQPRVERTDQDLLHVVRAGSWTDITGQLPYGDYSTDGKQRYAWLIEDAAPTTERCSWCWGERYVKVDEQNFTYRLTNSAEVRERVDIVDDCPVCDGAGRCDPIPARGRQRMWNWTPA